MRTFWLVSAPLWLAACDVTDTLAHHWDDSGAGIQFPAGWRTQADPGSYAYLACSQKDQCVGLYAGEPRGLEPDLDPMVYADMESTFLAANMSSCPVEASPVRRVDIPHTAGGWVRELAVCTAAGKQVLSYGLIQTPSHIQKFLGVGPGSSVDGARSFTKGITTWLRFPEDAVAAPTVQLEPSEVPLTEAWKAHPHTPTGTPDASLFTGAEAPAPPAGSGLERVHIEGPVGKLVAYQTPDPGDGAQHPVVVWAHGGAGGIGPTFWTPAPPENDQSAMAFRAAGIAMVIPAWRGENDNPGTPEFLRGEVEDLLAARDYAAALPWTDPDRVYVIGHSTGGSLVALMAGVSDQQRAVVAFGASLLPTELWPEACPVDTTDTNELDLRSPAVFAPYIRTPTVLIEGHFGNPLTPAQEMQRINPTHITHLPVARADHSSVLAPITAYLAQQIRADDLSEPFAVDPAAVQAAFDAATQTSATWPLGR